MPKNPNRWVEWITGDSKSPEVLKRVRKLVDGRRCLVSLDSDHNAAHVLDEIEAYAPLIPKGCYLVVEDTAVDEYDLEPGLYPEGGPGVAVRQFLEQDKRFVPDRNCERFMLGMNPGGWLRRVA
jgi:cephalosporin hydroxylase